MTVTPPHRSGRRRKAAAIQFEHRTVFGFVGGEERIDALLNEIGAEGWELVTAITLLTIYGGDAHSVAFIFKRERE